MCFFHDELCPWTPLMCVTEGFGKYHLTLCRQACRFHRGKTSVRLSHRAVSLDASPKTREEVWSATLLPCKDLLIPG